MEFKSEIGFAKIHQQLLEKNEKQNLVKKLKFGGFGL